MPSQRLFPSVMGWVTFLDCDEQPLSGCADLPISSQLHPDARPVTIDADYLALHVQLHPVGGWSLEFDAVRGGNCAGRL